MATDAERLSMRPIWYEVLVCNPYIGLDRISPCFSSVVLYIHSALINSRVVSTPTL